MSPEKQRIKIAEVRGWTVHPKDKWGVIPPNSPHSVQPLNTIPDYLNDLNVMRDAIMSLPSGLRDVTFTSNLAKVCGFNAHGVSSWSELHAGRRSVINATAAQRAEAFLKTLGLWEDAK